MPRSAHSTARCFASPEATNFAGPYVDWRFWPATPEIEERQTIEPPPVFSISSIAYLQLRNIPRPSTAMTSSQSSGSASRIVPERDDARVRHQHVESPVGLDRRRDHAPRLVGLRDVAHHGDDLGASRLEALAEPLQPLAVDVAGDDPRALGCEQLRRRPADPCAAPVMTADFPSSRVIAPPRRPGRR